VVLLSLVVARVLSPLDVGTLGLAVIVVGLVSMLVSFAENAAVILQSPGNDPEPALAGAVACVAGTLGLCAAAWWALAPVSTALGGDAEGAGRIRSLTLLLLWQPVLESVASYPRILQRRRLDLGYVAALQLQGALLFSISSAVMLGLGVGQASVVWGQLLATGTTTLLWWRRWLTGNRGFPHAWPPSTTWSALTGDSLRLLSGGVGGYLSERLDNLLVAGTLGPANASFYTLAWNLSRIPVTTVAQVMYGVVIPTAAACREDAARFSRLLRDTLRFSSVLISLAASTLLFFGPVLVEALLGSKWRPLGPALRVMAITILNTPLQFAAGVFLIVSRRAHVVGLATAAHLALQMLLIPRFAARWGVAGAAWADLAGTSVVTAVVVAGMILGGRPLERQCIRIFAAPVIAGVLACTFAAAIVPASASSAPAAIVAVLTSLLVFPWLMAVVGGRDTITKLRPHLRLLVDHLRAYFASRD
jgi:O-antigen/teichoic acid export membrane protein